MPSAHGCPDLNQYKRLASGDAPSSEKEALLSHLARCEACAQQLERLSDRDTLVELIRKVQTLSEAPESEIVVGLAERMRRLRPGPGEAGKAPTSDLIRFACSRCSKSLKAKVSLAGRKVKCPHCNVTVRVPAVADGASLAEARTLAPVKPGGATLVAAASGQFVEAPARELYDFLAPPEAPDELGRLGPYRVLRILGHGGMGVVFEAEDPQLRRKVALKAMLPGLAAGETARQRFLREARVAAAVVHDHIVSIYQVGEDRGVPFIAMAFLKGESLDRWLARQPRLPFRAVLRIARETAAGLAAAHKQGLIHRDIKPANLWIEEGTNRIKILDFGLARPATDSAQLTHSGAIVGTPAYMAPEQVNGLTLDGRCDLFSLGCVLYRLSTGEPPFKGNDTVSTLMAVATHDPPPPSQVNAALSEEFSDLVMQLLAKDPSSRTPSAQALLKALTRIEEHGRAPTGTYQGRAASAATSRKVGSRAPMGRPVWMNRLVLRIGLWTLPIVVLAGLIVLRALVSADKGELVIETDEPDVELTVSQGGKEVAIIDTRMNHRIELAMGAYEVALSRGAKGLWLSTDKFILKGGDREIVRVRREPVVVTRSNSAPAPASEAAPKNRPLPSLPAWPGAPQPPDDATPVVKISGQPFLVRGDWTIDNDELVQPTLASEDEFCPMIVFGEPTLSNYDLSLEAKKTGGSGNVGISFHWLLPGHTRLFFLGGNRWIFFDYMYKGAWGRENGNARGLRYSSNQWYLLKLEVRGPTFRAYLDGALQFEQTDARFTHGRVCLNTSAATARFRRIKISDPRGRVLFEGLPELPPAGNKPTSKARMPDGRRLPTAAETAAKSIQQQWAQRLKTQVIWTNSLGIEFALIPPGEFRMGSPRSEAGHRGNEQQHRVRITKPFYLGVYPVTQSDFKKEMGRNPSWFANSGGPTEAETGVDTLRYPVEMVTWYDAVEFCNTLSEKDGLKPYYRIADIERHVDGWIKEAKVTVEPSGGYRLPTEAQWEYACRAGTTTPFNFGRANNGIESNCNGTAPYGTQEPGPALGRPVPVGSYRPNAFGLYDMHGNVWQWCWDLYDDGYYTNSPKLDPAGPLAGSSRVLRGGSWLDPAINVRSASRYVGAPPDLQRGYIGFRVARDADEVNR
jgi:formylglycine-generating enzyme required for sulfatase activity/predicted Ser/Thr protein kinase